MNKVHRTITDATKQTIESIPIVFPVQYGKIYAEIAKQHNILTTSQNSRSYPPMPA